MKFALSSTVTTETGEAAVLHLPPTPSKPHTEVEVETEGESDAPKKKPRYGIFFIKFVVRNVVQLKKPTQRICY